MQLSGAAGRECSFREGRSGWASISVVAAPLPHVCERFCGRSGLTCSWAKSPLKRSDHGRVGKRERRDRSSSARAGRIARDVKDYGSGVPVWPTMSSVGDGADVQSQQPGQGQTPAHACKEQDCGPHSPCAELAAAIRGPCADGAGGCCRSSCSCSCASATAYQGMQDERWHSKIMVLPTAPRRPL